MTYRTPAPQEPEVLPDPFPPHRAAFDTMEQQFADMRQRIDAMGQGPASGPSPLDLLLAWLVGA